VGSEEVEVGKSVRVSQQRQRKEVRRLFVVCGLNFSINMGGGGAWVTNGVEDVNGEMQ